MDRVRKEVVPKQPKDLRIDVSQTAQISAAQSQALVQYTITGPDLNQLTRYTKTSSSGSSEAKGAVDVDSNLIVGNPEISVEVDRERAADLGRRRGRRRQRARAPRRRPQGVDVPGGRATTTTSAPAPTRVTAPTRRASRDDGAHQDRADRAALVGGQARARRPGRRRSTASPGSGR